MKLGLRGKARWAVVSLLALAGMGLLAAGIFGLTSGGGQPVELFGSLIPTATPTPFVAQPTATASPEPTPTPTPMPSMAPIARMIIEKAGTDAPVQVKGVAPTSTVLKKLGINAPGDDTPMMDIPDTPQLVAWYDFSGYPGHGQNAIFSAHVDWYPNIQGAFWGLRNLEEGNTIVVILDDDTKYRYRVTAKAMYPEDQVPMDLILNQEQPHEVVTLITCGGRFVKDAQGLGSYLDRLVVRAEIIHDEPVVTAGEGPLAY